MESNASFVAPAIRCGHCKGAIEGALADVAGVSTASVDIAAKRVEVRYDDALTDRAAIAVVIEGAGYEVVAGEDAAPAA